MAVAVEPKSNRSCLQAGKVDKAGPMQTKTYRGDGINLLSGFMRTSFVDSLLEDNCRHRSKPAPSPVSAAAFNLFDECSLKSRVAVKYA